MPVLENVSHFDLSETGLLVYKSGSALGRMAWVDRSGKHIEWIGEPGMWSGPRLSPDGKRVAVAALEQGNWDIWIVDLARKYRRGLHLAKHGTKTPSGLLTVPCSSSVRTETCTRSGPPARKWRPYFWKGTEYHIVFLPMEGCCSTNKTAIRSHCPWLVIARHTPCS